MPLVPETLPRALEGPLAPAWLVAGDEPSVEATSVSGAGNGAS